MVSKLIFGACFSFFIVYVFVGVILYAGFNGLHNEPYYAGFKYILIPALIFIVIFYLYKIKTHRVRNNNFTLYSCLFLMFTMFSSGYLGLLNKKLGIQKQITVAGLIVDTDAVKQRVAFLVNAGNS